MGLFVGLSNRPGREEAERSHRSEATKLSGAQMPEQRRAGQPVNYNLLTNTLESSWHALFAQHNFHLCLSNFASETKM